MFIGLTTPLLLSAKSGVESLLLRRPSLMLLLLSLLLFALADLLQRILKPAPPSEPETPPAAVSKTEETWA